MMCLQGSESERFLIGGWRHAVSEESAWKWALEWADPVGAGKRLTPESDTSAWTGAA